MKTREKHLLLTTLATLVLGRAQCACAADQVDPIMGGGVRWRYVRRTDAGGAVKSSNHSGVDWSGEERIFTNNQTTRFEACLCGDASNPRDLQAHWCLMGETSNAPQGRRPAAIAVPDGAQRVRCTLYIVVKKSYLFCRPASSDSTVCVDTVPHRPAPPDSAQNSSSSTWSSSSESSSPSSVSSPPLSCRSGYIACDGPDCFVWCVRIDNPSINGLDEGNSSSSSGVEVPPTSGETVTPGAHHLSAPATALIIVSFLAVVVAMSVAWGIRRQKASKHHSYFFAKKLRFHFRRKHGSTDDKSAAQETTTGPNPAKRLTESHVGFRDEKQPQKSLKDSRETLNPNYPLHQVRGSKDMAILQPISLGFQDYGGQHNVRYLQRERYPQGHLSATSFLGSLADETHSHLTVSQLDPGHYDHHHLHPHYTPHQHSSQPDLSYTAQHSSIYNHNSFDNYPSPHDNLDTNPHPRYIQYRPHHPHHLTISSKHSCSSNGNQLGSLSEHSPQHPHGHPHCQHIYNSHTSNSSNCNGEQLFSLSDHLHDLYLNSHEVSLSRPGSLTPEDHTEKRLDHPLPGTNNSQSLADTDNHSDSTTAPAPSGSYSLPTFSLELVDGGEVGETKPEPVTM